MADPPKEHRVLINEGTLKKTLNPPPSGPRPPAPKSQIAPTPPPSPKPPTQTPPNRTGGG